MSQNNTFAQSINHNVAFTNKRFMDFFMLVNEQADVVYKKIGITFPVPVSSTVMYLSANRQGSLTEIAKGLGLSHQLIAQRVKILLDLRLIEKHPARNDRRKMNYTLTEEGLRQSDILLQYCEGAEYAFNHLSEEMGVDMQNLINRAIDALHQKPFYQRYEENPKQDTA